MITREQDGSAAAPQCCGAAAYVPTDPMQKKNYITTSIAYTNAPPHLGFAYEVTLADIIARYRRRVGFDTFLLTGTDEHGDKIIRAAQKAGTSPQLFVDSLAQKFDELHRLLSVSYDDFIRTSDRDRHWPGAQAIWKKLLVAGDLYKDTYRGLYCVGCEAFITEKELVEGVCAVHGTPPEVLEEENYFFRLSKYAPQVRAALESGELSVVPHIRVNELLASFDEIARDVSVSRPERDVIWGVPVPDDSRQLMYVWFEALTNYVSALGYGRKDDERFKKFWPADIHVIGKDILRFHAVVWPAMLLAAGLPLPKTIFVHGFITSGGKKMSKSLGNVVDPFEVIAEFGPDALRYYFAREISPTEDGDFTREAFITAYNANLANGLGNLVSRTLAMAADYFDGEIVSLEQGSGVPLKMELETAAGVERIEGYSIPYVVHNSILPSYAAAFDALRFDQAADAVWRFIGHLDGFIADYEPFKLIKTDKEKTREIIWSLLYGLHYITDMLSPLLPETAERIALLLGAKTGDDGKPVSFSAQKAPKPLFLRKETKPSAV